MDAPNPFTSICSEEDSEVINLLKFELKNNDITYKCDLNKVGDSIIEFIIFDKNNKFQNQFNLQDFINKNRYFRIFESLKELTDDLINIIKDKKIEIESITDDNIIFKNRCYD